MDPGRSEQDLWPTSVLRGSDRTGPSKHLSHQHPSACRGTRYAGRTVGRGRFGCQQVKPSARLVLFPSSPEPRLNLRPVKPPGTSDHLGGKVLVFFHLELDPPHALADSPGEFGFRQQLLRVIEVGWPIAPERHLRFVDRCGWLRSHREPSLARRSVTTRGRVLYVVA